MTTESDPAEHSDDARPVNGSGVSVRTRLTVMIALLTSLALLTAGVVIYAIESERRRDNATAVANQEIAEFRQLIDVGQDPDTGEPFAGPEPLLETFLERNVPGRNEMLIGWLDDRVRFRSASPHPEIVSEAPFLDAVEQMMGSGGEQTIASTVGEVLVTVQPLRSGQDSAALVVVTFLDVEQRNLNQLMRTYAVVGLLSMLLITGLAAWQGGRLLAPLRRLSDTAREISVTDLSRRIPETGNDDITALTRTVNQMLARLEAAFAEQRRFLDDAGHELRTPLTVLGGHLELMDAHDPAEVEETRELLLDEIDRMGRLVGDLILLAKSRRPDFLNPTEVDLDDLTRTVLAKARAMGDRTWTLEQTAAVAVEVDEQRITQAVLQLVDNALKHTDPGDEVAIGSAVVGSQVRIWVRDSGDGIPADKRETVFERFGRGGVRPGDEGFGLGLSIVRAIAEAHGGSVEAQDSPGGGAILLMTLPRQEGTWRAS